MSMGVELAIPAGANPGMLVQILRLMAERNVNIWAYCTAFDAGCFTIFLVAEDHSAARTALLTAGIASTAHSVVQVHAKDHAGAPAALLNELREAGIDICHVYVAAMQPSNLYAIFRTVDDQRALRVLAATDLVQTAPS